MKKSQITAEVVSCLVREQFPLLAGERVVPVEVDGWDNSSFRVGDRHVARLPTDDGYVPAVAKEDDWLPRLRPRLPVAVPEPVGRGRPGCGFPRPWSLRAWLPGEPATAERVSDLQRFARDAAAFLLALQAVDPTGGPPAGPQSAGRGGPLARLDADVRGCLPHLPVDVDADAVMASWRESSVEPYDGRARWFHGDMAPSNLLVQDGRLCAVIDFGTCGVGDPACDLVLAWTHLDDAALGTFREVLGVDGGTWARGRGWALWKALLTLGDADPAGSARRYGWRLGAADVVRRVVRGT